jgi:hypothetical protein
MCDTYAALSEDEKTDLLSSAVPTPNEDTPTTEKTRKNTLDEISNLEGTPCKKIKTADVMVNLNNLFCRMSMSSLVCNKKISARLQKRHPKYQKLLRLKRFDSFC